MAPCLFNAAEQHPNKNFTEQEQQWIRFTYSSRSKDSSMGVTTLSTTHSMTCAHPENAAQEEDVVETAPSSISTTPKVSNKSLALPRGAPEESEDQLHDLRGGADATPTAQSPLMMSTFPPHFPPVNNVYIVNPPSSEDGTETRESPSSTISRRTVRFENADDLPEDPIEIYAAAYRRRLSATDGVAVDLLRQLDL